MQHVVGLNLYRFFLVLFAFYQFMQAALSATVAE